jgi:hypothetical protein
MVLIAKRLTIISEVGMFKQQKANFKSLCVRHLYPIKVCEIIRVHPTVANVLCRYFEFDYQTNVDFFV